MILLTVSFIAGILTVLAPCVLPLLPVIVGGSIGGGKSWKRALTVTASLAVSVIVFTLLIKASTLLIDIPQDFWKWFSGSIIIIFGLITVFPKLWETLPFLSKISTGSNKLLSSGYQKQNFVGDIVVGSALGPVFSTCSPTYFLVLATVLPENIALGILYLLAYSVGLSLSLLLVALIGQKIIKKAGVVANPEGWFKKTLGVLFLIVGIAIISGADKALQIKILDAGFFDVTKVEQKLLELVPSENENGGENNKERVNDTLMNTEIMTLEMKTKKFTLAPEISSPDGFVNTEGKPITLKELRGKVILLDIWTYSCINCQRTLPYINDWYAKYKDQGLEIVGLHTPEFAFEHIQKNVEEATKRFNIKYPVVLDNDYSTWNAYGNRYWPHKYLIDIDGYIVYDHIGEGGYDETEQAIQKALAERNTRLGTTDTVSQKLVDTNNEMSSDLKKVKSPEVYFGASRNQYFANGSRGTLGTQIPSPPQNISSNNLYLDGIWNITDEYAENSGTASIVFKYNAKDVYFVAESVDGAEITIYRDDVFVKTLLVKDAKLYELIDGIDYGEHTLRIEVKNSELKAFTFTFG